MTPQEQLKQVANELQRAADAKARAKMDADRNAVFAVVGKYIAAAIKPFNDAVQEIRRLVSATERMSNNLSMMEMPTPEVNVDLSSLKIPTPNVTVKPIVDIGKIKMPEEMSIKGWVGFMGYDRSLLTNPLPVQLRDASGNPIKLFENLTQIIGGGGGGGNHVIVDNLNDISITSSGSSSISLVNADGTYYNSDNPFPVSFSASGTSEVRQVSGAMDSVNIMQIGGIAATQGPGEGANALRVVHASDAIASVNIAGVISSIPVIQLSGAINSVSIVSNIAALDIKQVSGSIDSVSIVSNIAALDVKQVSGSIDSVFVTGSSGTTMIVGPVVADAVDDGNAPVQMGGVARTANPTAVAGGDVVKASFDDLGRQIVRPVQVRDLMQTAYASLTTGTETTLLAGVSGVFMDLVYVMGTNNSDAAVTVDLRGATGGGIVSSIRIPANGTAGVSLAVPIPQDVAADTWTADMPDITGTTVNISALFSREV